MSERETLRAAILARHPTVYAFTKAAAGLVSKSVVVQLLAGKYPGNVERQTARVWAALDVPQHGATIPQSMLEQALADVACARCSVGKRTCRKRRHLCRELWAAQVAAIMSLKGGGV